MEIREISLIGGFGKTGEREPVARLDMRMGDVEIGGYHIIAYEGLVRETRVAPQVGGRYFFKPARCMLQSRHSGVVSAAAHRPDGWRVRFEGITIA